MSPTEVDTNGKSLSALSLSFQVELTLPGPLEFYNLYTIPTTFTNRLQSQMQAWYGCIYFIFH